MSGEAVLIPAYVADAASRIPVHVDVIDLATRRGGSSGPPGEAAIESYLALHADALAYHRPGWLRVIHRAFGHEAKYFVATRGTLIVGVLPVVIMSSRLFGRFAVSVPFVNYGGVMADDDDTRNALLSAAVAAATKAGAQYLELRHTARRYQSLQPKEHKVTMTLPLPSTPDALWQTIDRKLRNQVRKGEKSDLQAHQGGAELLPKFYEVFARNMRDLGTPVYGIEFFEQIFAEFPDTTRVFVATSNDVPAAASILHWYRDRIEVPWASAIREYNPLCANVFLYWQMLRFACESGFATFDFGRSTRGEGPYQFKKQWGAQESGLVWEYWTADGHALPDLSPHNPKFALAVKLWQRLPLPVANALGPPIVRNIP